VEIAMENEDTSKKPYKVGILFSSLFIQKTLEKIALKNPHSMNSKFSISSIQLIHQLSHCQFLHAFNSQIKSKLIRIANFFFGQKLEKSRSNHDNFSLLFFFRSLSNI
jgi:hypothetical protein